MGQTGPEASDVGTRLMTRDTYAKCHRNSQEYVYHLRTRKGCMEHLFYPCSVPTPNPHTHATSSPRKTVPTLPTPIPRARSAPSCLPMSVSGGVVNKYRGTIVGHPNNLTYGYMLRIKFMKMKP